MEGFALLDRHLVSLLVSTMMGNIEGMHWIARHGTVNQILPLRLVNRHWKNCIDRCRYFWVRFTQTLPEWRRFNATPEKDYVVQFVLKRRAQKELRKKVYLIRGF